MKHEEHTESLRRGVIHVGAIHIDVASLGLHERIDIVEKLVGIGSVDTSIEDNERFAFRLIDCNVHVIIDLILVDVDIFFHSKDVAPVLIAIGDIVHQLFT